MGDRSRGTKKSKLEALAELKRVREGGSRSWKEEDTKIYDEVSEEKYERIVSGRLQRDDFVEDDGVDGYMDDGMDDWGNDQDASDDESDDNRSKSKKKKGKKAESKPKQKPPPPPVQSINDYRPVISAENEQDFMDSLLNDLDHQPEPIIKSRKRKPSPHYDSSSPIRPPYRTGAASDPSSDGAISDYLDVPDSDDLVVSPKKRAKTSAVAVTPAAERFSQMDFHNSSDDVDMQLDGFDDFDDIEVDVKPTVPKVAVKKEDPDALPSWLHVYDNLGAADSESFGPLESSKSASLNTSNISALEPDGSLRFFWLDYLEHEGHLYFVGKLKDKVSGIWVSCCVTVENLERNVFVLPREKRVEYDEDGKAHETDEVPVPTDVYADFDRIRRKAGVRAFKGKFVERNYAFGEENVPRGESQWLKVVYGFNEPAVPSTAHSPNIARIFGSNTSAFELLVLKRKIMGPCWLEIKNPVIDHKGISWCKVEVTVSDPKDLNPIPETAAPKDMPPLTVLSLAVRTIVNHRENKQEVVCCTARIYHNMNIDDPTPPEKIPCTVHTFVRPLDRFPKDFERKAQEKNKGISPMANERMLLNNLLVTIYKADPDVIVGHDFLGVSLDILLHRMRELKADHWSRLGRFRRSKWPGIGRQGSNLRFLNGRMLCDLASDGAKSMISSTTWSLSEMCKSHLGCDREDIDPDDVAGYLDGSLSNPTKMLVFLKHCDADSHFQIGIAAKVQILPLTKQLTNLAGNSWNKTLNGGRAERNEYILLHEFHRLKYICPDKAWGKKYAVKAEPVEDDPEAQRDDQKATKGRRDKFKGGLVFEPKRGLWDKFILVMDFNSLYPSIIQEYNIDFTTVEKVDEQYDDNGEEVQPEPPASSVPQGVLPRLIATLVKRRQQVKSLMKDKATTPAQFLQYDIKQQALKLTANSMYGCLGFTNSRFYARQLASLTTFKGREILTHTRELAESLQLDVIYGDTDSVFVNSNMTDLADALKISDEFKKAVNQRYRLLEIDLDGVFQRLLLLQKKKYAALKVSGGGTSVEVKGLDMKRREYCALSKSVSQYILDQILSGEPTEIVVEQIHEYLSTVGENVRNGKMKVDDFVVFKRLGKNPEDYPKVEGQPHVQVALAMKAKGGNAKAGDVIPYVFCLPEGEETAKSAQADRAKHRDELRKAGSELKIDYEFYLGHQILPPIERLCDPIEGTDRSRLAECLGLDPSRYKSSSSGSSDELSFSALDSQLSDTERYKDATPFFISCRHCKAQFAFSPLSDREGCIVFASGPQCPNASCRKPLGLPSLQTQLEVQIREHIAKFYEGWTVCTDQMCGHRTRMMGVYGRRCLHKGCHGTVAFEYTDAQLYTQLRYFSYLFDMEKAVKASTGTQYQEAVSVLAQQNADFLNSMSGCVEKYLNYCGRRWVEMSNIFSFMKL
ncbi:hypothetical protein C8J56DRAFT_839134 [Mycena floridula]|nr:hypothetical protein C8J56DRAFT_839134 [Mycena floridula]